MRITTASAGVVTAELTGESPGTAEAVWAKLPIEGRANTWGSEKPRDVVEVGDIAYWPPGEAICFFFGPTPASRGGEIRPASPVNVFAKLVGDAETLKRVRSGEKVLIERV